MQNLRHYINTKFIMSNEIIKIAGDDITFVSIPKSEYDHLVQCKQELLLLKQRMRSEMQSQLNNAFQQQALQILNQTNITVNKIK